MNEIVLDHRTFATYEPNGRITAVGVQDFCFTNADIQRGYPIFFTMRDYQSEVPNTQDLFYADLSQDVPIMRERPEPEWTFDKDTVAPRKEVTLKNVPPCTVKFTGPISGTQKHETLSDLSIGFTIPGKYTIEFEAFPYKPLVLTLQVQSS